MLFSVASLDLAARPGSVAPLLRSYLELPALAALNHLAACAGVEASVKQRDDERETSRTHRRLVASWRLMPLPAAVWTPIRSTGFDLSLRRSFFDGFFSLRG